MQKLREHDFVYGILCGLALLGERRIGYDDETFSQAVYSVYLELERRGRELDIDLDFFMRPHPIHGDSVVAIGGLNSPVGQSIAPFEAPHYDAFTIRLSPEEARMRLEHLPLTPAIWEELARTFLQAHEEWSRGAELRR